MSETEDLASHFRLQQIIDEPTYFLVETSSCTDLILTYNQCLESGSEAHQSTHPNWYH